MMNSSAPPGVEVVAPTWVRWRIVVLLMTFAFMNHFNRVAMAVVAEPVKAEFKLTDVEMGTIYSAFLLTYVIFMAPGGWLADRFGPRLALTFMGFGSALFVALTGLGGWGWLAAGAALPSFLVIRSLMGICTAPLFPAAGRAIWSWLPFSRQAWANGLVIGATTLGIGMSHVAFGNLADAYGWRIAFLIAAVCTSILALMWAFYARDLPSQHRAVNPSEQNLIRARPCEDRGSAGSEHLHTMANDLAPPRSSAETGFPSLLKNSSLMLLTLNYAAVGYFEYMLFYWMEHYFNEVRHLGLEESRLFATIVPLAMAVTMPLGGYLSDRLVASFGHRVGRTSVPVFGMLSSAVLLFLATHTEGRFWMLGWFALAHGAIGLCEAPIWVTGLELGGARCGTSVAIVNTGGNVGGIIAPQLTPWVGLYFGWNWSLGLGSLICLAAVSLWIWINPGRKSQGKKSR